MIATVHLWQNGLVKVYDKSGLLIPEYCGQYRDVKDKILSDAPPDTIFHKAAFRKPRTIVSRSEW